MACEVELSALFPDDVYIIVGEANPSVNNGVAVQDGNPSFIVNTFVGWKVRLFRNKLLQNIKDLGDGDTWYDYTSITAEFTPSIPAVTGEQFYCQAYKPA